MKIKLPLRFYEDHSSRDLDTPKALSYTKTHVYVDSEDPAIPELLDDAKYYAESMRYMDSDCRGLCMSAKATVKILKNL